MQFKTVLALGVANALYFLPHIANKLVFFPTVIAASVIPEVGNILKKRTDIFRQEKKISFLDMLLKNYIVCIAISLILAFSYPVFALPFFLGYSFTLYLNAFSKEGIQPFWPLTTRKTSGKIITGGTLETTLFYIFMIFAVAMGIRLFI